MASKKMQAANEGKNASKNVAPAASHSTSSGPMTRSKSKTMAMLSTQHATTSIFSKKPAGDTKEHQFVITVDSLGARNQLLQNLQGQSSPQVLAKSWDKSSDTASDTNSNNVSRPGSPVKTVRDEASPKRLSSYTPYSTAMPVMVTGTMNIDEQLAAMQQVIETLKKNVEEKDMQIATLMNKLEVQDGSGSSHGPTHPPGFTPQGNGLQASNSAHAGKQAVQSVPVASLSVQQLQDMIADTIRVQYGGPSQSTLMYSKPYTKRVDNLRMPASYQPPKFQQFDGKGNPRQHIAHFVETCNNAGTEGDLLVKQFVRSLRGNAFDWYTDLEPESFDNWEQMEREFLNRFYSTRRTVSMMELTNTRQWKDEPVVDYINRWRSLSLDCKDRLSEVSAIEMCIQGMHWGLLYILQGMRPRTFEELATCAHNMELSILNHGKKDQTLTDLRREKKEVKKGDKFSKNPAKESMVVGTAPVKISGREKSKEVRKVELTSGKEQQHRSTLKELEEEEYPFPDSDVQGMLEDLLQKKVIELPECKRPEEIGRVNDPKYCKYHRIISHPVERCFVLKRLIMKLAKQGRIHLDFDDVVESNHATVTFGSLGPIPLEAIAKPLTSTSMSPSQDLGASCKTIQFGSLEPVQIQSPTQSVRGDFNSDYGSIIEDDETWTVVTRKKPQRKQVSQPQSLHFKERRHERNSPRHPKRVERKMPRTTRVIQVNRLSEKKLPTPITLGEYFPKGFLDKEIVETIYMVSCYETHDGEESIASEDDCYTTPDGHAMEEEELLVHLNELPLSFGVNKALQLPERVRLALAQVLKNPEDYSSKINKDESLQSNSAPCATCCAAITFTDEDLQFGSKPHNRPLFVSGYIREQKVTRILLDGGSAVNIMSKMTMKQLGITVEELSRSRLMIQGFNQGGQRAMGMIRVELSIGDLNSSTLFHVIDAKTSYNLLLGRPWLHENGVIPSTLH